MTANTTLAQQLEHQTRAMASYAVSRGLHVPVQALQVTNAESYTSPGAFARLVEAHAKLAQLVAPGRPATIAAMWSADAAGAARISGPPLIGHLSRFLVGAIAAVVLVGGVHVALGFGTGYDRATATVTSLAHFVVANGLFVALSALGASFQALMTVQRRVDAMSFEERDVSSTWARVWLGICAGVLMATYLDIGQGSAQQDVGLAGHAMGLERPVLALLGGFGSNVVYRVLDTGVKALSATLDRNVDDVLSAQRTQAHLSLQRATDEHAREAARNLLKIQRALATADSVDRARALVDEILLPGGPGASSGDAALDPVSNAAASNEGDQP